MAIETREADAKLAEFLSPATVHTTVTPLATDVAVPAVSTRLPLAQATVPVAIPVPVQV